ncbi:MAG: protein kinase domain-containing protein [Frankia sp.]
MTATAGRSTPLLDGDPRTIGAYRVRGRLGAGGMGTVYLCQASDGRLVAVKVIKPDLAANPEFRGRFADEVMAARRVAPFCTAEVLDADPYAALPYLVTEYIDGRGLDRVVEESGPLPLSSLQGVAVGVVSALTAIHSAGIVHRDLKPSNVLLSYSGPRVIDFGIARSLAAVDSYTRSGTVLGSAGWMAPEQVMGGRVGPPADVFAWGLVVAWAATGRHPYGDGPSFEVAYRVSTEIADLEGVPAALRPMLTAALNKEPTRRPTAERLLLAVLGDHGLPDTAAAVTQVLGGSGLGGSGLAAAGGAFATRRLDPTKPGGPGGLQPTRIGAPSLFDPEPARHDDPRRSAGRDGDRQRYPGREGDPRRYPGREGDPRQYPGGEGDPRRRREMVPAGRASEWGDPADEGAYPEPYGRARRAARPAPEPPPARARRPRRRFRLPFKRLIITAIIVLLLLSAAGRISAALKHETNKLWRDAWNSAQHTVEQQVSRHLKDGYHKITDQFGG